MAIDITQTVPQYEAGGTFQFTLAMTVTYPATVAFNVYDFARNTVALAAVQSGAIVAESGNPSFNANSRTGLFYMNRVLPTSEGIYFSEWHAWDSASRDYYLRDEFQIMHTRGESFQTYADVQDVIKNARQIFQRAGMTTKDLRAHIEAADAWIDTKLGTVVGSLPVTPTPNFLRGMSKAGTFYFYYSERYAVERQGAPPGVVEEWDRYNEVLDGVLAGSYSIAGITVTLPTEQAIYVSTENDSPIFGLREWENQRRDPDIVEREDEADD